MATPPAAATAQLSRRNAWAFAAGTLGRDAVYAFVTMFLLLYLTEVVDVSDSTLWGINAILLAMRLVDLGLDPVMGKLVDSTRSRWGQFKPWLLAGGAASALLTVLLFTDSGLSGTPFLVAFGLVNLLWGMSWAANDIAYWGMLPALTLDPVERERIGGRAKVFASVGQFAVIGTFVPLRDALVGALGSAHAAYRMLAIGCSTLMIVFILVTVLLVREPRDVDLRGAHTTFPEMVRALTRNDQLLWAALAYLLFMVGYTVTGTSGNYFFKYVYGNEAVFTPFALCVAVGQIAGFALGPRMAARWGRRRTYTLATGLVCVSYAVFALAPMTIVVLGVAAIGIFFAAAVIQLLMIVFQADTIEYGQLKLGQRNGAVTFAMQPLINKASNAVATWIVGQAVIWSGINAAASPADVTTAGKALFKATMLGVPVVLVVVGWLVWRRFFVVDEARHAQIVAELEARGDLVAGPR